MGDGVVPGVRVGVVFSPRWVGLGESSGVGVVVAGTEFGDAGGGVEQTPGVADRVGGGVGAGGGAGAAVGVVGVRGGFHPGTGDDADGGAEVVGEVVGAAGAGGGGDELPVGGADEGHGDPVPGLPGEPEHGAGERGGERPVVRGEHRGLGCLLYTSDAADE